MTAIVRRLLLVQRRVLYPLFGAYLAATPAIHLALRNRRNDSLTQSLILVMAISVSLLIACGQAAFRLGMEAADQKMLLISVEGHARFRRLTQAGAGVLFAIAVTAVLLVIRLG